MYRNVGDADVSQGIALAGRGAGARTGDWSLKVAESGDLEDSCWLNLNGLKQVQVMRSARTERHLLRPYDVLVSARAGTIQTALVPPGVSRTAAGITLLVVRPHQPDIGMGHFLWYFLSSSVGRVQLAKRQTVAATTISLSARSVGEIEIPMPAPRTLDQLARIVEVSEDVYMQATLALQLRRELLRDSIINNIDPETGSVRMGEL